MKYRVIHFRIMVRATDIEDTTIMLGQVLSPYGRVRITADGPYYKDEELLEFNIKLEPSGDVQECVVALQATAPSGWVDSPVGPAWLKRDAEPGVAFLLPQVDWATLSPEEADELPGLALTGRQAPEDTGKPRVISVNPDGEVTGWS